MQNLQNQIDQQIASNQGKNLFHNQLANLFAFTPGTVSMLEKVAGLDKASEELLLEYLTQKALEEFCRVNQYYAFDAQAKADLKAIYAELLRNCKQPAATQDAAAVEALASQHFQKLRQWLSKTNPFAEKLYKQEATQVALVPCAEYSPELQLEVMHISLSALQEPVLDIGCGKSGQLVAYLRQHGVEAQGIDRFAFEQQHCETADWLEYNYGTEKWGTIISNLGFSNHFKHHHYRADGNYLAYAMKYMEILKSLKPGGRLYYAPDLPFIEEHLDPQKYRLENFNFGMQECQAACITRLD